MSDVTILLHGWSDSSESFRDMKAFLVRNGIAPVESVLYADYESREDAITFGDIVDGLNDRMIAEGIIDASGRKLQDADVIVHSTGGLVIRHWIWRYYLRDGDRIDECPIRRVVMLAPANFGSPLAHRGKSFLGSLVKGRRGIRDFFEVGRQILTGLELGSPYQWWLSENDLLGSESHFVVSRDGTDGTVVISGTPLDSVKFVLDPFVPREVGQARRPYRWLETENQTRAAFGILPGLDHGSIVDAFGQEDADESPLCDYVLRALRIESPGDFESLRRELADVTRETFAPSSGRKAYQQFLVRAVDDQDEPVDDFTLEFSVRKESKRDESGRMRRVATSRAEEELSEGATRLIAGEFHRHSLDPSYRRFLVDLAAVTDFLEDARERLRGEPVLSLTAHVPPVDRGIRYDTERLRSVALYPADASQAGGNGVPTFFHPNTTTLLEIRIDRVNDYVFLGPRPRSH